MQQIYRIVAALIANKQFDELRTLPVSQPEYFNWAQEIFEGIYVQEQPDACALLWTDGERDLRVSYRQMAAQANQLVNFLRSRDVAAQDVLLMQMALLPLNWQTILASVKGGFCLTPAATILGVQDIVYRFGKLMPKVVIADSENAPKIDEAEQISGKSVAVKIIADGTRDGWYSLADIDSHPVEAVAARTKSDDPLFLFFTSGTTGMPKVVTHTHLSYPFGHLTTASWIGLRAGDIHYNISQPGWAKFAWSSFFAPWSVGATIFAHYQPGRFHAPTTLQMMERYGITTFCAPPTVLRLLILEDLAGYRFQLRECVAAGEPLNPEVIEQWQKGTGMLIRDGFGQTESTCMVGNLPGSTPKFGSMGKSLFLYDVVIADEEGRILPDSEEGNICVRMDTGKPNGIFSDYFGDPDKKATVFRNGLYYTGDKAYRDEDGFIWFVGRDDDVIKASDYRVGPFEVESVLLEHDAVQESAVVGSPHPIKGFEVKAFVVLQQGYSADETTARELFAFSRKNLAPYKMPRLIEFVSELPKTISGKIRRVELRAREAEGKAKGVQPSAEFRYEK
ncbi:acyl-CoA synthetase [Rurimicrobium arvi]|uniref:AMP-binding protein n=1 Tax=Rurimicrobium arvi TaxID=2049916 RepID=A0ABP8N0Y5_9BACT